MKKIKCPNKQCKYEWIYKGRNRFYACCPQCHKNINIQNMKGGNLKNE
jgi:hypothetical protein